MIKFIVGFIQGAIAVCIGILLSRGFQYLFEVRYTQVQNWLLKGLGWK